MPGSKSSNMFWPTIASLNCRVCAIPLVRFVNQILAVYMPGPNKLAALFGETVTVVPLPAGSVLERGDTFTHDEVVIKVQLSAFEPVFVTTKETDGGAKGPPGRPLDESV